MPNITILNMPGCSIRLKKKKKDINVCKLCEAFKKPPPDCVCSLFLYLIMNLYVLFIYQLTCHFRSFNIMRVLLKLIMCCFNWKALLHFPITAEQITGRCTYFNKGPNSGLWKSKVLVTFFALTFSKQDHLRWCPSLSLELPFPPNNWTSLNGSGNNYVLY